MNKGYTLIEIIIVITILTIMMGGALASFANFRDKNTAQSEALVVADRLRKIQAKASAVELPEGCTGSVNFQVTMTGSDLTVKANCSGATVIDIEGLGLSLTTSTYLSSYDLIFDSRSGNATPLDIDICARNHQYRININQVAFVSRPVYIGTC
jgi:prepilin-type N-terminal cleavage/methylation domain-containing protein